MEHVKFVMRMKVILKSEDVANTMKNTTVMVKLLLPAKGIGKTEVEYKAEVLNTNNTVKHV